MKTTSHAPSLELPHEKARVSSTHDAVPIHRGVNFGFFARNGYFGSAQARAEVDRMAELSVDWVCLIVTVMQDTFSSTRQYRDFRITPADDELRDIIDYIHARGMHVQLRPMQQCWDGSMRCHITFPWEGEVIPGMPVNHWTRWFDSMIDRTLHYASLAQRSGCEAYGLDSELDQTTGQNAHWKRVVAAARSVFDGHLTTGHTPHVDFLQELSNRPDHWFKDLDSLGTSFYAPGSVRTGGWENVGHGPDLYHMEPDLPPNGPDATVEEIVRWFEGPRKYFREISRQLGKPFYFAECGCCSAAGATAVPYRWDNDGGYDGEVQARYFDAVLTAFWNEPWWMGFYLWKWDEQNDRPGMRSDPRGDKGFTVWGKPAANMLQRWFCRPERRFDFQP